MFFLRVPPRFHLPYTSSDLRVFEDKTRLFLCWNSVYEYVCAHMCTCALMHMRMCSFHEFFGNSFQRKTILLHNRTDMRFALYETPYTPDKRTHHDTLAKIETLVGKNNSAEGQNLKLKNGLGRMIDRRQDESRDTRWRRWISHTFSISNLMLFKIQWIWCQSNREQISTQQRA